MSIWIKHWQTRIRMETKCTDLWMREDPRLSPKCYRIRLNQALQDTYTKVLERVKILLYMVVVKLQRNQAVKLYNQKNISILKHLQ